MNRKLPTDAFETYVALGTKRSYSALADHYGVDRKTVLRRAQAENWQQRLADIEQRARQNGDQKLVETIEQMNDRHLKTLRVIQGKAIQALREMPLSSAMDAVRALDLALRNERLIRGEPTDRNAVDVEQIIKREYDRWLIRTDPATPSAARENVPIDDSIRSGAPVGTATATGPAHPGMPVSPTRPTLEDDDEDDEDDEDDDDVL